MNSSDLSDKNITDRIQPLEHHIKLDVCTSRPKYRQGKEFKAVKVYTSNQESRHLLIQGIPAVGIREELLVECEKFGLVEAFELIPNYPLAEKFTHVFYIKYGTLREARYSKKKLDNRSFYGGLIHICYAPELETTAECGDKLFQRKQYVQNYNSSAKTHNEIEQRLCPLNSRERTSNCQSSIFHSILPTGGSSFNLIQQSTIQIGDTDDSPDERRNILGFPQGQSYQESESQTLFQQPLHQFQWSSPSLLLFPTTIRTSQKSHVRNITNHFGQRSSSFPVSNTNCVTNTNASKSYSSLRHPHLLSSNLTQKSLKYDSSYNSSQPTTCSHSKQLLLLDRLSSSIPLSESKEIITPYMETMTKNIEENNRRKERVVPFATTTVTATVTTVTMSSSSAGRGGNFNIKVTSASALNELLMVDKIGSVDKYFNANRHGHTHTASSLPILIPITSTATKIQMMKKVIELKDKEANRIVFHKARSVKQKNTIN